MSEYSPILYPGFIKQLSYEIESLLQHKSNGILVNTTQCLVPSLLFPIITILPYQRHPEYELKYQSTSATKVLYAPHAIPKSLHRNC